MSVSMKPGATALTVMPREPTSRARDLREADDAGLGRGVVGLPGVAHGADHRGDVDDAALRAFIMPRRHGLAMRNSRVQIGVDHRVPLLILHAHEQVVAGDAGVVDQDGRCAELGDIRP